MRCIWYSLFCCVCAIAGGLVPAAAQTTIEVALIERTSASPVDLSVKAKFSEQLLRTGSVLVMQDAPNSLSVDQVAALPQSFFKPFSPAAIYPLSAQNALWLYFRVLGPAPVAMQGLTFELPKPFVDRVAFYHRSADGSWNMEQAGDHIPQAQWSMRGMHPQFVLPQLAPGMNEFYVKVNQLLPLHFDVTLKTTEQAMFSAQNSLLQNGMLLGLLIFIAAFSIFFSVAYKNMAYAWYSLYVAFVFFCVASYVGVGFYAFWPTSTRWPEMSQTICLLAATAAQLQFCRAMFLNADGDTWLKKLTLCGVLVSPALIVFLLLTHESAMTPRINVVLLAILAVTLMMVFVVIKAAAQRSLTAYIWMLAYCPVIACLTLTLAEQFGLLALPWLPYNAMSFAVAFEVMLLLLALHLHVKSNHANDVRKMTLDELDPLTGFVSPTYYPDTLAQLWSETRHLRQDLAIAYVRADIGFDAQSTMPRRTDDELVLRCVRMLRMVTRTDDTVARIGANVFAILMPGVSPGPNLAGKLSRLVALGLMHDPDDSAGLPVKFRVAASSFTSFSGTSTQMDKALKEKLAGLTSASERGIEFVKNW